jgi:hypothetical protein
MSWNALTGGAAYGLGSLVLLALWSVGQGRLRARDRLFRVGGLFVSLPTKTTGKIALMISRLN